MSLFVCVLLYLSNVIQAAPSHPHIVFVIADDLGWNDVEYQATESATKTPHIDALAESGVKLNNYYVQPTCSPSRTSFLTGRYAYKVGVFRPFGAKEKACMPFVTTLPDTLKGFGFTNHLIGKWHLGFCKTECLPTSRGFDTFYGIYNGGADFYTHYISGGFDWRIDNSTGSYVMWDEKGVYSVDLMDARAEELISNHNPDTPMFLYYAMQSVHTPIQPRAADVDAFSHVADEARRNYLALVKGVDDSMGALKTALVNKGMWDDTIIIFSADNGGTNSGGASNWPLSGAKGTTFEGGIKAAGFISGKGITNTGITSNGLMHISDWFPTLMSAIGESQVAGLDGVDNWDMISTGANSARTEIVHNADTENIKKRGLGTLRQNNMKLISDNIRRHDRVAPPESSLTSTTGLSLNNVQLYDLDVDPNELTDLSDDSNYRSQRATMLGQLKTYQTASDVLPSVHVDPDDNVINMDAEGAFKTGWC